MGARGPKKGSPSAGRPLGAKNKVPALLKEAILEAAAAVGRDGKGKEGIVGYLRAQAVANPAPFLGLLGKVLPLTLAGDPNNPLQVVQKIERAFVSPAWIDAEADDSAGIRAVN